MLESITSWNSSLRRQKKDEQEKKSKKKSCWRNWVGINHEYVIVVNKVDALQQWHRSIALILKNNGRRWQKVETCSICFERKVQLTIRCGHKFCTECYFQHERVSKKILRCSMCRKRLSRGIELVYPDQSLIWAAKYSLLLIMWKTLSGNIYTCKKRIPRLFYYTEHLLLFEWFERYQTTSHLNHRSLEVFWMAFNFSFY